MSPCSLPGPAPAGRPAQAQLLTPCVVLLKPSPYSSSALTPRVALLSAWPCSSRSPCSSPAVDALRRSALRPALLKPSLCSRPTVDVLRHPAFRRRSQASPSPCSPLPCLSSSAGRCLSVAPCCYQVPHVDLHLFHCHQIIFPAPISTWPSLSPRRHPLRSLSPLSRRGCPGNAESTLS